MTIVNRRVTLPLFLLLFALPLLAGRDLSNVAATRVAQFAPAITANGFGGFTAGWLEQDSGSKRVVAGRVSASGDPLDGTGIIVGPASYRPVIARGSSEELIVWIANGRLVATRLTPFGSVLDATPIDIAPLIYGSYDVAWNGSRFFVVWSNGANLIGSFIGPEGGAAPPQTVGRANPSSESLSDLDLAWNGRQFLLAYGETTFFGCDCPRFPDHVRLMRISAAGGAIDTVPPSIAGSRAHVATSGAEWLIALDKGADTSSLVVREDGGVLHFDPEVLLVHWFHRVGSDVVWNGSSYVVALQYNGSASDAGWLAAIQVSESGIPLPSLVTSTAGPFDSANGFTPSVAADDGGNVGIAISEMTPPSSVPRARLYLMSELAPMPAPPPAPRNAVSYFGGNTARIDWQSGGGANGFMLEISTDFGKSWFPYAVATADARTINVAASVGNQFRVRAFGPGGLSDGPITSIGSMFRHRADRH